MIAFPRLEFREETIFFGKCYKLLDYIYVATHALSGNAIINLNVPSTELIISILR